MPNPDPVLIAGGGIGGLATALALARAGHASIVLERSAQPSGAGAGIQLGPNAVKVLRDLGVAEAVGLVAATPDALVIRNGANGKVLARMPLGATIAERHRAPYWVVHRADLHLVLTAAAAREALITILHGRDVVAATRDDKGVEVCCGDGTNMRASALIGADGVWSRVRTIVAPGYVPQPSGYSAYRALLPRAHGGVLAQPSVGAWLSPDAHVVHYPVRGGRQVNIVLIAREPEAPAHSIDSEWSCPADGAAIACLARSFSADLRAALASAPAWHKWTLVAPLRLPRWSAGPIVVMGDAAHPTLPFLAQGGAMALEDAAALARCVSRGGADLSLAFVQFEAGRRARATKVQSASTNNGRIFHLSGPLARGRDLAMRLAPPEVLLARYDWLYRYGGY